MITVCLLIAFIALSIALHLLWALKRIHAHPYVEPAHIAVPGIAPYLSRLISDISKIAEIEPPELYFYRAQLPNAFAVATIMRSELFIADELLEEANLQEKRLDYLMRVICHEIAHLKNNDSVKLGLLTYISNLSVFFKFRFVQNKCTQLITKIEHQADLTANELFQKATELFANNS